MIIFNTDEKTTFIDATCTHLSKVQNIRTSGYGNEYVDLLLSSSTIVNTDMDKMRNVGWGNWE